MANKKFYHAGLGGTFDRFHEGHKELIDTALSSAVKISVGITVNNFSRGKKLAAIIESYEERVHQIEKHYEAQVKSGEMLLFPLKDEYGPTLNDSSIDCLVVTEHTFAGAEKINQKRLDSKKSKLPIIIANLIKDEEGEYISSTRIRQGQIDRSGRVYEKYVHTTLILTEIQKNQLKKPYGQTIHQDKLKELFTKEKFTRVSVVGDVVLSTFINQNIDYDVGIYDGRTQRKPTDIVEIVIKNKKYTQIEITNKPGEVSKEAINAIKETLESVHQLIKVSGEEDLLVLPLILLQPLESVVLYGQPKKGIVLVRVTEKLKEKVVNLITH